MAKKQKSEGKAKQQSVQLSVLKDSGPGALATQYSSKYYNTKDSKGFLKKAIKTSGIIETHRPQTTVIVENTNRPEWQMTAVEKMDMVRKGVSKKKLESLKNKTNLDYDKLSTILSTNRATLINKKGAEHFSSTLSERIVSIADLYSYGFEVFEDEATFNKWIFSPNKALGGKQPFELLDNQFGREEVKNLIGRIDYGVYS